MGGKEGKGGEGGREGKGEGRGGEREEDVEGPGKWSAPGPVLALGGPVGRLKVKVTQCQNRSYRHLNNYPVNYNQTLHAHHSNVTTEMLEIDLLFWDQYLF